METEYTEARLSLALAPRAVRYFPTVDSTNDIANDWLKAGADHGAVVIADEQRAGRGRLGRTWHTPPGVAIAASVVLRPKAADIAHLNMVGTLAVYQTLKALHISEVSIKWPNDVLINGLKVCGILPQASWDGEHLLGVVLGIGVNVRNDFSGHVLADVATSIEAEIKRPVDRVSILAVLLYQLDNWLTLLGSPALSETYKAHLNVIGKSITVSSEQGDVTGIVLDINHNGGLILRAEDGTQQQIYAGDVTVKSYGAN